MEDKERLLKEGSDEATEQQIRLEEAKRDRIKAEAKMAKQESREAARQDRRDALSRVPLKTKVVGGVIVLVALVGICGFLLPWVLDDHETQYTSESSLKQAVEIENLSAIDYVYRGIAEKPGKFLWMDSTDYRVKYVAHVRANYKMSDIQFTVDDEGKVVTAYLPEAEIGTPVLDENEFGYLPESANADMPEILALCKEDAATDLDTVQVQKEAYGSLKNIVEALTMPLLDDGWSIEFKSLEEYAGGASDEAE